MVRKRRASPPPPPPPPEDPSPLEDPPTASSSSESEEEQQPQQPSPQSKDNKKTLEKHASDEEVEEEEEDDDDAEEDDDEEDNDKEVKEKPLTSSQPAPPAPAAPAKSQPKPESSSESGSESEDESESDEDGDDEPLPANSKVKPLASKPMDQKPKPKAQSSSAPARSGTKRTAAENNTTNNTVNDSKRAKKKPTTAGSEEEMEASDEVKKSSEDSRKLFQRLWGDEDEITILKGLSEFALKTRIDPTKDVTAFYEYLKKSLVFEASINQLKFKLRRFRDKFRNAEKAKNPGEDPVFPKPHDQKVYELSKKFWGEQGVEEQVKKLLPNGKVGVKTPKKEVAAKRTLSSAKKQPAPSKKLVLDAKEEEKEKLVALNETRKEIESDKVVVGNSSSILIEMYRFDKCVGLNGLNEMAVKRGLELIGESEKAELEERWKKLQIDEMELFVNRARLIEEQTRLILEAYKAFGGGSGGH